MEDGDVFPNEICSGNCTCFNRKVCSGLPWDGEAIGEQGTPLNPCVGLSAGLPWAEGMLSYTTLAIGWSLPVSNFKIQLLFSRGDFWPWIFPSCMNIFFIQLSWLLFELSVVEKVLILFLYNIDYFTLHFWGSGWKAVFLSLLVFYSAYYCILKMSLK